MNEFVNNLIIFLFPFTNFHTNVRAGVDYENGFLMSFLRMCLISLHKLKLDFYIHVTTAQFAVAIKRLKVNIQR